MAVRVLPGWSETIEGRTRPSRDATGTVGRAAALLRLQATAGNRATARLVAPRSAALNTFHEDGVDSNPAARYGHRSEKQTMTERYLPDRPSGTEYRGSDFPDISIGSFADIHLVFLGKTVDACNNDADTSQHTWTVNFRGKIRP
jgi:hypothetical protein